MSNVAMRSADDMLVEASMIATGPGFITQSGVPSEEQFEFIRSNFGDPRADVKPKDYYVFQMIASSDGLDSYYTRQDTATSFTNFVRDLRKGQSVLGHHKTDSFSYGSSFAGEVVPADESRPEYESTFYPQWDTPDMRTKQWLVGDYYITRGVTLNDQSADDLVRSIELGGVRKASISFMVGQYVCGLDGKDLLSTFFGPMPDESCEHFPGVAYEGQVAYAWMKNNTLVETSLVYKNASPSSMFLRKAESLAERGTLSPRDVSLLESRFQVRLPRYVQRLYQGASTTTGGTTDQITTTNYVVSLGSDSNHATASGSFIGRGMEESNMAKRSDGDATARALARAALTEELEPEQAAAPDGESSAETEAVVSASLTGSTDEATGVTGDSPDDVVAGVTDTTDAADEVVSESLPESVIETAVIPDVTEAVSAAASAPLVEAAAEVVESDKGQSEKEEEPKSTREEDVVAAFVDASDRLASALARNPDAFDSGQLAVAARAERAIDLALIDAGCDTTVGGHVARTFETRSKVLRETLGEPLTVEAIRSLQSKASLGETLYEELVKDAVAARTGAQGESFNAAKYRDLLMAARDVAYVKEEVESWKEAKKDRFTPGRSVVPRQIADARPSKDERRTLPEVPTVISAQKAPVASSSMSILEPRRK